MYLKVELKLYADIIEKNKKHNFFIITKLFIISKRDQYISYLNIL